MNTSFWLSAFGLCVLLAAMGFAVHNRYLRKRIAPEPTEIVRAEIQRFRDDPEAFSPLYRPGMNTKAIAGELMGLLWQMEETARGHGNEIRLLMPDMDTARVGAEILVRHGYRCAVLRQGGVILKVAWDQI